MVLQFCAIPVPCAIRSAASLELMKAIVGCSNTQIFRIKFIQYYIQLQWKDVAFWTYFYTFLMFMNIVLFTLLLSDSANNLWYFIPFLIVNLLLALWEFLQVSVEKLEYFRDLLNCIDVLRIASTVAWIVLGSYDNEIIEITWIVTLLTLARGLTGFRLFDGTRYYVRLISTSLNEIKYFLILFAYSTFTFGVLSVVAEKESMNFTTLWANPYGMNFGVDAEDSYMGRSNYRLKYTVFLGITVINIVLMLNLLISILGDSFDQFQLEKTIIDYKEKAELVLEIQRMLIWGENNPPSKYLHVCKLTIDNQDSGEWEGKVLFTDKKIEILTRKVDRLLEIMERR